MPTDLPEIKYGQVWEKDGSWSHRTTTRIVVAVSGDVVDVWHRYQGRPGRHTNMKLTTFQRWAATAKLMKEADNGR
jgi:hypothetical protein